MRARDRGGRDRQRHGPQHPLRGLAGGEGREAYDAVTARAVGRLSTLAELASPLLKPNGVLVAWKGKRDADEEQQLERAAEALAMRPEADPRRRRPSRQRRHRHLRTSNSASAGSHSRSAPSRPPRSSGSEATAQKAYSAVKALGLPQRPPERAEEAAPSPQQPLSAASSFSAAAGRRFRGRIAARALGVATTGAGMTFWITSCWPIVQKLVVIQ